MNHEPLTMNKMNIVFFGSFQTYSVQILEKLTKHFHVTAVVTTAPKPKGRHLQIIPTAVEQYAQTHAIPVYHGESLEKIPEELARPDFIVVAGYGKLIPLDWLKFPTVMPVNLHQSLLPQYRGAFPGEWAILRGEEKTGVTLVKMSLAFDKGEIIAQRALPIAPDDTRETLYQKLYDIGGDLLVQCLPKIARNEITPKPQPQGDFFYARKITRDDGFIPWKECFEILTTDPMKLDLKLRAFAGWPGVWTNVPIRGEEKRLRLIALTPDVVVQLEGKNPVSFSQFSSVYLT